MSIAIPALAACGGDSASPDATAADAEIDAVPPIDAEVPDAMPVADLTCINTPLPTTAANDPIVIDGVASSAGTSGLTPLAGVTTEAYAVGNATALFVDATNTVADGMYQLSVVSNGQPVNGYIRGDANDSTYRDTYLYPPFPLAASTNQAPLLFLSDSTFSLLGLIGVTQPDTAGLVAVLVLDCAGDPIAGATITAVSSGGAPGTIMYTAGQTPSTTATATDSSGLAFVFNVGPGNVVVDATANAMSLREHTVEARARTITTTAVAPGPITP